ncbi:MAG: porin [Bacteroidota bacterium]
MKKPISFTVFSLMLFPALSTFAQTPPMATPPSAAAPAGDAAPIPAETPLAPSEAPAVTDLPPPPAADVMVAPEPAPPTVEDRLGTAEGKLEGMDESLAAVRSTADKLSKIKVSGYLQGRFESRANSLNGVNSSGRPQTTNQFLVRRGRLKTTYDGTNAEFMLQIDAASTGVTLKDAEATFVDTWSPFGLRLTLGQFKWTFGYEVLQSSGDREMPERSLVIRTLFPGERDRGVRLTGRFQILRFAFALVNGTGTQDAIYPANDSNTFKDLVGRVGIDAGTFVGGVSGYWGRAIKTTLPTTPGPKWTDANMDKMVTVDEITFPPATAAGYQRFRRGRIGVDAQLYLDIPSVGGLALKGEAILSKDTNLDYGMTAANPCLNVTSVGWILTAVQNIGDYVGVVARLDSFDPSYSKSLNDTCATQITAGQGDRITTFGGGLLLHGSGNIKATITYEHIAEQSKAIANDIFTAQLQARF